MGYVLGITDDTIRVTVSLKVYSVKFQAWRMRFMQYYVRKVHFLPNFYLKLRFFLRILAFGVRSGVPRMTPLCWVNQPSHEEHKNIL